MEKDLFSTFKNRIRSKKHLTKIISAEEAAQSIRANMTIGCSGFTPVGYPKVIPTVLAKKAEQGDIIPLAVWCGASAGSHLDGQLSSAGIIKARFPYQTNKTLRAMINNGIIDYADMHLSQCGQNIRYGFYGNIDIAIIEATAITEEGGIVPTTSVGDSPTYVQCADKVIIEINTTQPNELEGIHDIYIPQDPPNRRSIPIISVRNKIGQPFIACPLEKIIGIVPSSIQDDGVKYINDSNQVFNKIADNILDFFDISIKKTKIPISSLPMQFGVGRTANVILSKLAKTVRYPLSFYSEVLPEGILDVFNADKLNFASGCALTMSSDGLKQLFKNLDELKDKLVLRPTEITNHPEVIRRLGVVSVNTAVEVDIWGNVNSSHANKKIINGIGGSGDYARNASIAFFVCPSLYQGTRSNIVFSCSHIDHTDHDVDVIVTEHGIADLRGLSPVKRAHEIISKCAAPEFKEELFSQMKKMYI